MLAPEKDLLDVLQTGVVLLLFWGVTRGLL